MNIGGGEAADQLVRMMLSGSEVAVRLSGSAIKNVLALTMALAKKHKTISGKVNLAKMLKETRDVRRFAMSPEQYQQFRQRAGKQKILFSAIRDSDNKGKVVDVIMPVTEIDRANMIFERIRYTGQPEQARQDAPSKEQEARVGQEAPQREQERPRQEETPVTPPVGERQGVTPKKGSRSGTDLPDIGGKFDIAINGCSFTFMDVYESCGDQIYGPKIGETNSTFYNDPDVNAWFAEALETGDQEKLASLYEKVLIKISEDLPIIPFIWRVRNITCAKDLNIPYVDPYGFHYLRDWSWNS